MTHDIVARCGGSLVQSVSPAHEHDELKRSLAACYLCQWRAREKLGRREYHEPWPTRSMMTWVPHDIDSGFHYVGWSKILTVNHSCISILEKRNYFLIDYVIFQQDSLKGGKWSHVVKMTRGSLGWLQRHLLKWMVLPLLSQAVWCWPKFR